MNWIHEVFITHSALQAVIILSIICAVGLALGKVRILGVSLGATFVFFMGIVGVAKKNKNQEFLTRVHIHIKIFQSFDIKINVFTLK